MLKSTSKVVFQPYDSKYKVQTGTFSKNNGIVCIGSVIKYEGQFPSGTYYTCGILQELPIDVTYLSCNVIGDNSKVYAYVNTDGAIRIQSENPITNPQFIISGSYTIK